MLIRATLAMLVVAAAAATGPVTASAEASSSNTANVGPVRSGPTVSQGSAGFDQSGIEAQASSQTSGQQGQAATTTAGGGAVTFKPIPFNALPFSGPPQIGTGGAIIVPQGIPVSACPPGQTGFFAFDADGNVLGVVCVGPGTVSSGTPTPTAVQLAEEASAAQPWPVLQVRIDPAIGLTGLASRFGLVGDPRMPDATASAGALSITVHAMLVDVVWAFGDGGSVGAGADASRIVDHVYQTDTLDRPGGYPVAALLRYRVTYSVNGGPPAELGVKGRPYTTSYVVNQLQPEAVSVP